MKTILLPIEFSERGEYLVDQAIKFAKDIGAQLKLLHVAPSDIGFAIDDMGFQYFPEVEDSEMKTELTLLQKFQERIIGNGIACDHILKQGEPSDVILAYAKEIHADYIAIGTNGRSGVYDLFVGSVTKAVTRKTHLPVLVIPIRSNKA